MHGHCEAFWSYRTSDDVTSSAAASAGTGRTLKGVNAATFLSRSYQRNEHLLEMLLRCASPESKAVEATSGSDVDINALAPEFLDIGTVELAYKTISITYQVYQSFEDPVTFKVTPHLKAIVMDTNVPLERDRVGQVRLPADVQRGNVDAQYASVWPFLQSVMILRAHRANLLLTKKEVLVLRHFSILFFL